MNAFTGSKTQEICLTPMSAANSMLITYRETLTLAVKYPVM